MPLDPNFSLYFLGEPDLPTIEGVLYYDEKHEITVAKTRQPLESGATLTDHAVRIPDRLTLQGLVSDLVAGGRQRGADAWQRIRELADARTRFDVVTPIGVYQDMLLINAETTRNASTGGGLIFKIELEEVLFVSLTSAGLVAESLGTAAQGRAGERQRGTVQTVPLQATEQRAEAEEEDAPIPLRPIREATSTATGMSTMPSAPQAVNFKGLGSSWRDINEFSSLSWIPMADDLSQSMNLILGGQAVNAKMAWSAIDDAWNLGMRWRDGTPIIDGVRTVTGADLLDGARGDFAGRLVMAAVGEGQSANPGRDAWRTLSHGLIYGAA